MQIFIYQHSNNLRFALGIGDYLQNNNNAKFPRVFSGNINLLVKDKVALNIKIKKSLEFLNARLLNMT